MMNDSMMYNDLDATDFDHNGVSMDMNSHELIGHDSSSLFTIPKAAENLPKLV